MMRITIESGRPYQGEVNAWIRAHGVDQNDCTGVEINAVTQLATFEMLLRDSHGQLVTMSTKPEVLMHGFCSVKLVIPPAREWCEVEA